MHVLVIDDEQGIRQVVCRAMTAQGYDCESAADGAAALELAARQRFDLVFCDVMMEGMSGLDVLRRLRAGQNFDGEIVIMTAQASVEAAIEAVQAGADDYISKPFNLEQLTRIAAATAQRRAPGDVIDIPPRRESGHEMRGRSQAILDVVKTILRVAQTDLSVLITGETGTGKELAARLIHRASPRAQKPFIALNCGALPDSLLESELFGHVRGAFTGADVARRGIFEEANGGTIFLDEIGETSLAFQVKLLRVLEAREVTPLGANVKKPIDVRVLSASNRGIAELEGSPSFRADLLFRLNGISVHMPPLRQRREDIAAIALAFFSQYAPEGRQLRITREALATLEAYDWPGNVRQLKHVCQQAAALSRDVIRVDDLPKNIVQRQPAAIVREVAPPAHWPTLEEMQLNYVSLLRQTFGDNKTKIATILRVNRKTVYGFFEKLDAQGNSKPIERQDGETTK